MKQLNYSRLIALNPTVYATLTNREGQQMDLVEHPLRGEDHPVIILYHAEKLAFCSDFYDTDDLLTNEDYQPIYIHGDMLLSYEID